MRITHDGNAIRHARSNTARASVVSGSKKRANYQESFYRATVRQGEDAIRRLHL